MRQLPTLFFILLLFIDGMNLYAQRQGQALIDSLVRELSEQKQDTDKIKLFIELSLEYAQINNDSGIKFAEQGLHQADSLGWKRGEAGAAVGLGFNYLGKGENEKALTNLQNALSIDESIGYKNGIAVATAYLAYYYRGTWNKPKTLEYVDKALKLNEDDKEITGNLYSCRADFSPLDSRMNYYMKALKLHGESGNISGMAAVYNNLGGMYKAKKDDVKALEFYFKSLKIAEEYGFKKRMALAYQNIGTVYMECDDYTIALEYYAKQLKIEEELGNKSKIAGAYTNIGIAYKNNGDYEHALDNFQKCLVIDQEIGDKYWAENSICGIAEVYTLKKDYLSGIKYCLIDIKLADSMKLYDNENYSRMYLGANYLALLKDTGRYKGKKTDHEGRYGPAMDIPKGNTALRNALKCLKTALDTGQKQNDINLLMHDYQYLAEAYELAGDLKNSVACFKNFEAIRDSTFSKEKNEKILKMSVVEETDKIQLADSLQAIDNQKLATLKLKRQESYTFLGVAGIILLVGFSFFIVKERRRSEMERQKSDALLLNILPEEVATQLKNTGTAAVKQFDNVTVLFTDFANFTEAGARMSPQLLIEELNTCFKAFDEITSKHGIEKIKTIGDAYLAVCGLPTPDTKHAENVVRAAKEISAFMEDRIAKVGNRTFEIRLGIHSGSVVAGIVGIKKFAYDIWGDTVNTAARMEQNSEPGKINISQTTHELVKDMFTCTYRGEIDAKGKGMLKMYYVV